MTSSVVCKSFKSTGSCKYGRKCKFSHDIHNIKSDNDDKYICIEFSRKGVCSWGNRCKFKHTLSSSPPKLDGNEAMTSYQDFLRASLSNPRLSGKRSDELIWDQFLHDGKLFNVETFLGVGRGKISVSSAHLRKQFILGFLTSLSNSTSAERSIHAIAAKSQDFHEIVHGILAELQKKHSLAAFQDTFIPLIFALTHSILMTSSPFPKQTNLIFSVVRQMFDEMLCVFCDHFGPFINSLDGFQVFLVKSLSTSSFEFRPSSVTHYLLPFLELIYHIVNMFPDSKLSHSLKVFIVQAEKWILDWKILIETGKGSPFESSYNVLIVNQALEKLSRVSDIALQHLVSQELIDDRRLAKELKSNRSIQMSNIMDFFPNCVSGLSNLVHPKHASSLDAPNVAQPWIWGVVEGPGGRHSNDHFSIKDIDINFIDDEMLCKKRPALPGNHQLTKEAHWLDFGPERLIDTHFRLFREDFMRSCRESIQSLLQGTDVALSKPKGTKSDSKEPFRFDNNLFIYPCVSIFDCTYDERVGIKFQISYQPRAQSKERAKTEFERSYLVALVPINESNKIFFAKTGDSLIKDGNHLIEVIPLRDEVHLLKLKNSNDNILKMAYMSNILLDAVIPILQALKSHDPFNLPFTKYICPLQKTLNMKIDPPMYAVVPGFSFDLSFMLSDTRVNRLQLNVTCPESRANAIAVLEQYSSLDSGQSHAFVAALSSEYTCIQGPPGTGKSFLGVRIVQAILKSQSHLGPIVVVCHTNHALDQFLEHLLDNKVEGIVRIGTRTGSERIKPLVLDHSKFGNSNFKKSAYLLRDEIKNEISQEFNDITKILSSSATSKIVEESWHRIQSVLDQYFPGFSKSLQCAYDDEKDKGFTIKAKGKKEVSNPFQMWLLYPATVATNRNLEELVFCNNDPWSEISKTEKAAIRSFVESTLEEELYSRMNALIRKFKDAKNALDAINDSLRIEYLSRQKIIGVTTTGAAMNQTWLKNLGVKVVICEEAGEILEAHTLSFLSPSLSHLIMIGDHLQLRPHINEYGLSVESREGKKYSFDLSQFERMQLPEYGYPLVSLKNQRRMRPEISQLIRNTIYPDLIDSPNVLNYPDVLGIAKNMFFLDHRNLEDSLKKKDQKDSTWEGSHTNSWEAEFSVTLAKYILNQGYDPSEITILTPYLGQLVKIKAALAKISLMVLIDEKDAIQLEQNKLLLEDIEEDSVDAVCSYSNGTSTIQGNNYVMARKNLNQCIRVSTVDNYQGEENRIIIASLVRNCGDNRDVIKAKIGFLSVDNRANVLLSRAKEGLYLLGHAELLSSKSDFWANVLETMKRNDSLGTSIPLQCQLHPEYSKNVSDSTEIRTLFPDGGCIESCQRRLLCGHKCPRLCHSDDPNHIAVFCPADCLRIRNSCDHRCPKRCGDDCGPCTVTIETPFKFEGCEHIIMHPKCHEVQKLNSGEIKCKEKTIKTFPCGHKNTIKCFEHPANKKCSSNCHELLPCGHSCHLPCHKISDPNAHAPVCIAKCDKILTCGHACGSHCHKNNKNCPECQNNCEMMECPHSKCNHPCKENCNPCIEPCSWSRCEHVASCPLPCGAPCIRIPCDKRCTKILKCGHQCPSICGEVCPSQKYCQECGDDKRIREAIVDLVLFQAYEDIDVNETPIIVLDCGHFKTVETLDGILSLNKFYCKDENGHWIPDKMPKAASDLVPVPVCPDCRQKITQTKRYWRVIRSAQLDQSEKRYLIQANKCTAMIANEISSLESMDEKKIATSYVIPKIRLCIDKCHSILQMPSEMLWKSCVSELKRKDMHEKFMSNLYVPRPPNIIKARFHLLVSHFEGILFEKQKHKTFKERLLCIKNISSSVKLGRKYAISGMNDKFENDIFLEEIKWNSRKLRLLSNEKYREEAIKEMKANSYEDLKSSLLDFAITIRSDLDELSHRSVVSFKESSGWTAMQTLSKALKFYIKNGYFEDLIDFDELAAVYKALLNANEFSGTGHAYRCPNGHIYFIGECGMAMQQSSCPDCGATIGGANHNLNSSNSHAADFEGRMTRALD